MCPGITLFQLIILKTAVYFKKFLVLSILFQFTSFTACLIYHMLTIKVWSSTARVLTEGTGNPFLNGVVVKSRATPNLYIISHRRLWETDSNALHRASQRMHQFFLLLLESHGRDSMMKQCSAHPSISRNPF